MRFWLTVGGSAQYPYKLLAQVRILLKQQESIKIIVILTPSYISNEQNRDEAKCRLSSFT